MKQHIQGLKLTLTLYIIQHSVWNAVACPLDRPRTAPRLSMFSYPFASVYHMVQWDRTESNKILIILRILILLFWTICTKMLQQVLSCLTYELFHHQYLQHPAVQYTYVTTYLVVHPILVFPRNLLMTPSHATANRASRQAVREIKNYSPSVEI